MGLKIIAVPARLKYTGIILEVNMTMEEMIQEVRDIKVSKEIQKIWLEQNELLQRG